MPPQNYGGPHPGGPRPGGRPSAPSLPAQFDATYDPSGLRTVSSGGPGGYGGGHGGGGGDYFDPAALMELVYGYKQRGADADLARREKTERDERQRASWQAGALRNQTPVQRGDPALAAAVARAQAQHNSVITAEPFNPTGAIADYYQYSRGGK